MGQRGCVVSPFNRDLSMLQPRSGQALRDLNSVLTVLAPLSSALLSPRPAKMRNTSKGAILERRSNT